MYDIRILFPFNIEHVVRENQNCKRFMYLFTLQSGIDRSCWRIATASVDIYILIAKPSRENLA